MKKGIAALLCSILCLVILCGCREQGGDSFQSAAPESSTTQEDPPQEPGELQVRCGETAVDAQRGTFSWFVEQDGMEEGVGVCADSPHPLQMEGQLPQLNGEGEVSLSWDGTAPDKISARCWPDTEWGNTDAESQQIPLEGDGFALREGGWIYAISAEWDSSEAWGGQAVYFFYGETP